MRSRRRWSDTERRWGPFTWDVSVQHAPRLDLVLDSGCDQYTGCTFRVTVGKWTLIVDLPPIIRPYREKVAAHWDAETVASLGRDWYWHVDSRKYGICFAEAGYVCVYYGRQSMDSRTEQRWGYFLPWMQWRQVQHRWYGVRGEPVSAINTTPTTRYERELAHRSLCPKVRFTFRDYDGETLEATTHIEEREWRLGTGAWRWLGWFRRPQVERSLELAFSGEVGRRKGSWKGGTIGHSIALQPGELHTEAFLRYCQQHDLTLVAATRDATLTLVP